MSTTLNETRAHLERPADGETRILIPGVRWSFYETFLDALPEGSPVRLAYDGKDLEIMVADRWLLDEDLSDYIAWMDRVRAWARKLVKKRKR
jgi:hypothetical protein